jgi:hypothetical protein
MGDLMTDPELSQSEVPEADAAQPLVCDFCGKAVERVRRIALDGDYDRLQKRHAVQYACEDCSEAKERRRLDTPPG